MHWPTAAYFGLNAQCQDKGFIKKLPMRLERLHPDWKITGIRRAAPASCLQSICISLKPPAHEGRF
jgi:hypothetical protein